MVLLGLKALAVALLWIWLARASARLTALALGLIIGGALGNATTAWPTARWPISCCFTLPNFESILNCAYGFQLPKSNERVRWDIPTRPYSTPRRPGSFSPRFWTPACDTEIHLHSVVS